MLSRLADKLILQPSNHSIEAPHKLRELVEFSGGHLEIWRETNQPLLPIHAVDRIHPELFVLKFPGTGGRAERGTPHPAEVWDDLHAEVWTVNPPGYGGSSGPATIKSFPAMAEAAFEHVRRVADGRAVVVIGNSLGNLPALYVSATYQVDALLLRNPPPLHELIIGKHGWWNFGLARFIAQQVPAELCTIRNASETNSPALFVMSGKDRMVPPQFQQRVIDAHAGENRVFLLPDADHASPITEVEAPAYLGQLTWLRSHLPLKSIT